MQEHSSSQFQSQILMTLPLWWIQAPWFIGIGGPSRFSIDILFIISASDFYHNKQIEVEIDRHAHQHNQMNNRADL